MKISSETQRQITLTKSLIQNYFETGKALNWKPYLIPVCEYIKKNYDLTLTNTDNQNKKFIIILDEINRAEISKVLGELFFSIDPGYRGESGRVTTQYANLQTDEDVFKEGFYIPDNVYIIGTVLSLLILLCAVVLHGKKLNQQIDYLCGKVKLMIGQRKQNNA